MKTRPILFQPDMVRAILDGRKSQTRRVVKPQPVNYLFWSDGLQAWIDNLSSTSYRMAKQKCPYGVPGDFLYVRESWCVHARHDGVKPSELPEIKYLQNGVTYMADVYKGEKSLWMGKTRPSIFMPREYSRLTLEITNVRVERIKDIVWPDIRSEGVECHYHDFESGFCVGECGYLRGSFELLWDKMHKKSGFGWSDNPSVWVGEFKKVVKS